MLLRNSLYSVISANETEDGYEYVIHVDPEHPIYKAHFPGNPITPGVCILQMALEMLSLSVDRKLEIQSVKNVKFLKILVPRSGLDVGYAVRGIVLDEDNVKAQITVSDGEDLVAKISMTCRIVD